MKDTPIIRIPRRVFRGTIPFVYNKSPIEYDVYNDHSIIFHLHKSLYYWESILISPETLKEKFLHPVAAGFMRLNSTTKIEKYVLDAFYKTCFRFYKKFYTKR